jgi:hypothetical protein
MNGKVISGRKLGQQPKVWLRWAKKNGPVVVKERGDVRYVLLRHEDYEMLQKSEGVVDAK